MTAINLDTIGSIAIHIAESFPNLSPGVSGNLVEVVNIARLNVQNYTGVTIGSNSIAELYLPAVVNFAKADAIEMDDSATGGDNVKLGDLSVSEAGASNSEMFRNLAESSLKYVGRGVKIRKTLV